MIGRLRGRIIERGATEIIVDVGGVGYQVAVPARGGFGIDSEVDLHVHTHLRQDALLLFGFAERRDREVFDLLITVPNVGPTKALAILETEIDDLVRLVVAGDTKALAKLPGIGKRTAERMVVDLREKLAALAPSLVGSKPPTKSGDARILADLVSALAHLGYRPADAEREAARTLEAHGAAQGFEALLRHALDALRRR